MRASRRTAGYTLPELTLVIVIIGVFVFGAVNNYTLAAEQGRVDQAQATMHSVWVAQRLYKLEHATFATTFDELSDALYLQGGLDDLTEPFVFTIVTADQDEFHVSAQRSGSGVWVGTINLNHNGLSWGAILGGGKVVEPATLK